MRYKGYEASVEFDEKAEIFFGKVLNTSDVITFQSESSKELMKEFQESVDEYLAFCENLGEEPEKPFSGKILVRLGENLHKEVALIASRKKTSINTYIVTVLSDAVLYDRRILEEKSTPDYAGIQSPAN